MDVIIKRNKDIVEDGHFYEKSLLKLQQRILGSDAKRIILTGGHGVGKSINLYGLQFFNLDKESRFVYSNLGRTITIPEIYDEEKYLTHYFNIKYLEYLEKTCQLMETEQHYDSFIGSDNAQRIRTFYDFLNSCDPKRIELFDGILKEALISAKEKTGAKKMNIVLDDFDMFPNTEKAQTTLIDVMKCFDKIIIGVNSSSITSLEQKKKLEEEGYIFIDFDSFITPIVIKEIVRRRLNKRDHQIVKRIDFEKLFDITHGNVGQIIRALETVKSSDDISSILNYIRPQEENDIERRLFLGIIK